MNEIAKINQDYKLFGLFTGKDCKEIIIVTLGLGVIYYSVRSERKITLECDSKRLKLSIC